MKKLSNSHYGLQVRSFPKHKQWAIDQDYLDKLTPEEKEWMGKFNQEFYRNRVTKGSKTDLHNTTALRRDCYARENAANRDLYAVKAVGKMIVGDMTIQDEDGNSESVINTVADISHLIDRDIKLNPKKIILTKEDK
jgi:hypothetical protein